MKKIKNISLSIEMIEHLKNNPINFSRWVEKKYWESFSEQEGGFGGKI